MTLVLEDKPSRGSPVMGNWCRRKVIVGARVGGHHLEQRATQAKSHRWCTGGGSSSGAARNPSRLRPGAQWDVIVGSSCGHGLVSAHKRWRQVDGVSGTWNGYQLRCCCDRQRRMEQQHS
uniref:Uncharacterized protein n=1 Tax=Ascaris lumbricoides TaxID=6252 RepID=A0A0M3I5Z2_ASCLU